MKLTSMAPSVTHRVLLYGAPKSGKSELAGKLSEHYNLLWFDIEQGYVVLTKLPTQWQERIDVVSLPDSRVYPIAVETWLKIIRGTEVFICAEHGKCSCAVCKKNNAPIQRICLNELGPRDIAVFDSLTQFTNSGISNITRNQPDDYKLDFADWGQLAVLMDKFLSQVQVARYNVVCITHEAEVEFEDGKSKLVPVCGSSKSSRNTAKYFDHVVYCEVRNKKHVAGSSTGYSNSAVTGSRTNVELEKSGDKGANLLDIFTSWKDWDAVMDIAIKPKEIPNAGPTTVLGNNSNSTVPVDSIPARTVESGTPAGQSAGGEKAEPEKVPDLEVVKAAEVIAPGKITGADVSAFERSLKVVPAAEMLVPVVVSAVVPAVPAISTTPPATNAAPLTAAQQALANLRAKMAK